MREPYPELIVLDWMMPGGSGIQFLKQLKQDEMTRQIPVVMLTARGRKRTGAGSRPVPTTTSPSPSPPRLTARLHAVMRRLSHLGGRGDRGAGAKAGSRFHRVSAEEKALDMGPTNSSCCTSS